MSGLLCCSAPPYNARDWRHQAPQVTQNTGVPGVEAVETADPRTLEWVMTSQGRPGARCRLGQCGGQDCGDGFCVNVWNSMVHV